MAFIELRGIEAGYTKYIPILKDFNLSVEKGELLSLLGPSGCGKTTTLRTIAGFIIPDEGSIVIGGKDYTSIPPNKRNIGLVFQNYALFPHLTVFDNVAYGLRRRKVPKEDIKKRVAEALNLVSLQGFEQRLPARLSGGQQQRVALARSIVIWPDLLLLDEPLSNLDAKLRDGMRAELSKLQKTLGITMIYVTHDQIEALSLSTRIVVMNDGNIEQIGTPDDIYERPATPFVAKFIGFDNCLRGIVRSIEGNTLEVYVDESRFKCIDRRGKVQDFSPGDTVDLFFRPNETEITTERKDNSIEASVQFSNYQGSTTRSYLKIGDITVSAVTPGRAEFYNSSLYVYIPPEKIIVEKVKL